MDIGTPEILIVVAVILLLFGATKLPTFARSLGRSMRIFKSEIKGIDKDDDEPAKKAEEKPQPQAEAPKELAATASPSAEAEAPADEQPAREPVAEKQ
jgi:sec-independent protein translocase protein TatA